ncbi:poly(ADP-ribose) glycohydrolase-like [Culicoides brevitarsis]|uniref:poly(ADP-ribose) glycohydrolase-like n=1 Tax=Culicoides brevitarsis TaxID=469753 RepID=UPI00307B3F87
MESMNNYSDCVPAIHPSSEHTVLFEWPIVLDERFGGTPTPKSGNPHWNQNFVRLPCARESTISVFDDAGSETIKNRWQVIREAFATKINNSKELEAAILSYNENFKNKWKFRALHSLFEDDLSEEESEAFFEHSLPKIIKLALQLPELIPWAIPLLKQGNNKSVSLSQQQVGSLLANAFLCTFPRRNSNSDQHEYANYPNINFSRLFQSSGQAVLEKIKCICHYFRRITSPGQAPSGVLTISRRFVKDFPKWSTLEVPVTRGGFIVDDSGTIEDATGKLQVDFANKFLGGGVLGHGCVQEEIRFVICPELLVSMLFVECMKPNEAVLVTGAERFSNYSGYASTFKWSGNHEDTTQWDTSRRKQCTIVAIDALAFRDGRHQYKEELMLRELNKAFVGFYHELSSPPPAVASGNWGCGAFGGEPLLKSLLQLIVCAQINRPLHYFTFHDEELKQNLEQIFDFLRTNNVLVKDLWRSLKEFSVKKLEIEELYPFIQQSVFDNSKTKESPMKNVFHPKNRWRQELQTVTTRHPKKTVHRFR